MRCTLNLAWSVADKSGRQRGGCLTAARGDPSFDSPSAPTAHDTAASAAAAGAMRPHGSMVDV
jgi:hypothetical protein